jgi:propionyl-CoA carboxylase alpha chain
MFKKLLIANRGEIAVRIMKTAQKLGIKTVAVYSEADTNDLHVLEADESYLLGPAPSVQSYLNIDKIIEVAKACGAEAIHPGYGFLSEKSAFAKKVKEAGITFIGPDVPAIELMGDKIQSKLTAVRAGVNVVPGSDDAVEDLEEARTIANRIGYPVMIKAAAGGGGKGMRIANNEQELADGMRFAASEAQSSFNDRRVFIEKYIRKPRHIEIQVLGDQHGNVVWLGERECSVQRRHQKVVEEAPSPFLDEATRKAMGEQAVALAKAVGYYSAGTVEFIVDENRQFYFLEMNTRLQVEHRVTELITGIDLVEQMIKVALGQKLPFRQEEIVFNGWALECRVYAEDPKRNFLPSSGRIHRYQEPRVGANVLIDNGVQEGDEVSMYYDPMIAKVCTHAPTRAQAIADMRNALSAYIIRGVQHNLLFLEVILANERFQKGEIHTGFIEQEFAGGFKGAEITPEVRQVLIGTAIFVYMRDAERAAKTTGQLPGFPRIIGSRWVVTLDDQHIPVQVRSQEYGYDVTLEEEKISVRSSWVLGQRLFQGTINGRHVSAQLKPLAEGYVITHGGVEIRVRVRTQRIADLSRYMPSKLDSAQRLQLTAPIAGLIVSTRVKQGDEVKAGQELLVIEAMKMENVIYAEDDVIIREIRVKPGDSVQSDQLLILFDMPPPSDKESKAA